VTWIIGSALTPTGWFVWVSTTILVWLLLLAAVLLRNRRAYTKTGFLGVAASLLLLLAALSISTAWLSILLESV